MLHAAVELGRRNATCQLENWLENDDGNQLAMGTNWSFGSFMSTEERGKSGAKAGQKRGKSRAKAGQNLPLDSTWNPNKGSQKCWIEINK